MMCGMQPRDRYRYRDRNRQPLCPPKHAASAPTKCRCAEVQQCRAAKQSRSASGSVPFSAIKAPCSHLKIRRNLPRQTSVFSAPSVDSKNRYCYRYRDRNRKPCVHSQACNLSICEMQPQHQRLHSCRTCRSAGSVFQLLQPCLTSGVGRHAPVTPW